MCRTPSRRLLDHATNVCEVSDALDDGPFFHGTKAHLSPGDLLVAGHRSNYRTESTLR